MAERGVFNEIVEADTILQQLSEELLPSDKIYTSVASLKQIQELLKRNDAIIRNITNPDFSQDALFTELQDNLKKIQYLYDDLNRQEV